MSQRKPEETMSSKEANTCTGECRPRQHREATPASSSCFQILTWTSSACNLRLNKRRETLNIPPMFRETTPPTSIREVCAPLPVGRACTKSQGLAPTAAPYLHMCSVQLFSNEVLHAHRMEKMWLKNRKLSRSIIAIMGIFTFDHT